MARGHFYPLPPPFIGGRQPYAPSLGNPQSGPAQPPPPNRVLQQSIINISRTDPWTLIYVHAIAPILAIPPVVDNPPPSSLVNLNIITKSWERKSIDVPLADNVAPFAVAAVADNPPPRSNVNLTLLTKSWEKKPNEVPLADNIAPFAVAAVADNPPPRSLVALNTIQAYHVPRVWWPLPKNVQSTPASGVIPDNPPKSSYVNLNTVVRAWQPGPPRPRFQNPVVSYSGPAPVGSDGEPFAHMPAHIRAVRRAVRHAHGRRDQWPR